MRLQVAIGADHGGFELKQELMRRLGDNVALLDMGAYEFDSNDDYPDYVFAVAQAVASGDADRGILLCGSGVGACVAANKVPGVRAAVCHDTYSAHQGVEHDDLNVLCLGARVIGVEVATELTVAFLMARFTGEERHLRRLEKVKSMEAAWSTGEVKGPEMIEGAEHGDNEPGDEDDIEPAALPEDGDEQELEQ